MTQIGPFLPVSTLVIGAKEHVEHHKVLHDWFNKYQGGQPGGVGGGADVHWTQTGRVIGDTYTPPYVFSHAARIGGLLVYAEQLPTGDRTFLADLYLNGESVWADTPDERPVLSETSDQPIVATLPAAIDVAIGDVVKGYVVRSGGAYGLFMAVFQT